MITCEICKKDFKYNGFIQHEKYCREKNEYYKQPCKCLNPDCTNIITYKLWKRNKQKYCCRLCCFTKERREQIGALTKILLRTKPEIFKNFGKVNKINIKYEQKNGTIVNLQSSYEKKVAVELDKHNIDWCRPSYLNYIDINGNIRKYFPDFYLKDYNIFLDPKNDWLIKRDREKIRRASLYNNVKILILTEQELAWNKILKLI